MTKYLWLTAGFFLSINSFAAQDIPDCMAKDRVIGIDNNRVIKLKSTTDNQYKTRAHVKGPIEELYDSKGEHNHFAIRIGSRAKDILEVVYNNSFGELPELTTKDMTVEACGDYITSNAPADPYPESPAGAIIHWVHYNPHGGHDSGYLVINGKVYGQGERESAEGFSLMKLPLSFIQ